MTDTGATESYWETRAKTAELKVLTFHEAIVNLGAERVLARGRPRRKNEWTINTNGHGAIHG